MKVEEYWHGTIKNYRYDGDVSILLYPRNIRGSHKTTFPPPQPSVPVRSHLGAFSGAPPEGALITEGFYINTIASPMMCE